MSHTTLPNTAVTTIRVADLVEFTKCPTDGDAEKLFLVLQEQFHNGHNVILSFEGMDFIRPPFLKFSICRLLLEYTEEEIRARLHMTDMEENDLLELDYVLKRALEYYKEPEKFEEAFEKSLRVFKEF